MPVHVLVICGPHPVSSGQSALDVTSRAGDVQANATLQNNSNPVLSSVFVDDC